MATLFGGAHARANQPSVPVPSLTLAIQTSVQGRPRPIIYGTVNLAGNIIDALNFQPVLVASNTPGSGNASGKGGLFRGPQSSQPQYEWQYFATVLISLCEGPIASVNAFTGDGLTMSHYGGNTGGGTLFTGTQTQTPFGFLSSAFPLHALSYRGEAYIAWQTMFLGTSTSVPNFVFEVTSSVAGAADFAQDANPRDVVTDFLSNAQYGVPGWPTSLVAGMSLFANWCQANGLVISPALVDQTEASQFLATIAQATYSEPKWSGGVFDMIPYGEMAMTGHGATYTPNNTPDYVLVLDDFLPLQGGGASSSGDTPIGMDRTDPQKLVNNLRIEYLDRSLVYVPTEIDEKDEASIASTRERPSDVRDMHLFKVASAAATSAAYQLRRERVANTYYFTLPKHFVLVDLMDLVELPLDHYGLSDAPQVVRIKEISENADRSFTFTAEDFDGAVLPPLYLRQQASHAVPDFNVDPGAINTPVVFEMPAAADPTASTAMLYAAVSGGPEYGGADVYSSSDGVNYVIIDQIKGTARMGVTTGTLPSFGTGDTHDFVDIGDPLGVDLTQSRGTLGSGSLGDMLARNTLCYLNGELIAYELATLTSTYHYTLQPLLRGAYGTAITAHSVGEAFVRIDGYVARLPYEKARTGQPIYLKFVPFNRYGGGQKTLADATAYIYTPQGLALAPEDQPPSLLDNAYVQDFVDAVNAHKASASAQGAAVKAQASVDSVSITVANQAQAIASLTTTVTAQLGNQLAQITTNATAIATVQGTVASLSSTVTAQGASISTNATAITSLNGSFASLSTTVTSQGGQITSNASAMTSLSGTVSSLNTTVSAQGVTISSNTTAISGNTSSIGTINGNLSGRYTLDIDVSGKIAGFSLINGGGSASSFDVRADKFNVWASGFSNTPVFSISTIGGVAGVTINGAYLGDLSALNNAIANNAISNGAVSSGNAGGSNNATLTVRSGSRVKIMAWTDATAGVAVVGVSNAIWKCAMNVYLDGVLKTQFFVNYYNDGTNYWFTPTVGVWVPTSAVSAGSHSASVTITYLNNFGSPVLLTGPNIFCAIEEINK